MFLVVEGDTWEYWEPGEYKNSDKEFSCMAIATDGLKIYLSQVKISIFYTKNIFIQIVRVSGLAATGWGCR